MMITFEIKRLSVLCVSGLLLVQTAKVHQAISVMDILLCLALNDFLEFWSTFLT